jgi:aspartate-semialdehyde dehydrogenase
MKNMNKRYNVAVVGVGAVGLEMLRCLRQRSFPVGELRVFARSPRDIKVDSRTYSVKAVTPEGFEGIDIALFAGTEGEKGASLLYAPEAIKRGAVVIDNGADFRLKKGVPLVVPEVNPQDLSRHKGVIANPNCSTIQMVLALWPVYKMAGLRRVIVATYQAASGAGRAAARQLWDETKEVLNSSKTRLGAGRARALPQQIAFNVFPHIGGFGEFGYTSEEWKMVRETHKIMHDKTIRISSTTVRVPVEIGHCEAVYIETKKAVKLDRLRKALSAQAGLKIIDEPLKAIYPLPIDAVGKDEVFVGRIRKDPFVKNGFWMWVVADNLRKGAALNAIQIGEELIRRGLILSRGN